MQFRCVRYITLSITVVLVFGLCFVSADAQKRKRRSRRVTRPAAVTSPSPAPDSDSSAGDPRIISTADQSVTSGTSKSTTGTKKSSAPESEQESLRRTLSDLSGKFTKLADKVNKMEEQQRTQLDLERLARAEQRAENLSTQLRGVQTEEIAVQGQLDDLEFALQPANIERAVGNLGTTRPEDAREQMRKQLESRRTRLRARLDQLAQSRVRLEAAITSADAEVELLRKRVDAYNQEQNPATDSPVLVAKPPGT